MRIPRLFGPAAFELVSILFSFSICPIRAYNITAAPNPNLDFRQLGQVALTGNFDSIATYSFDGQNEDNFNANGSQALLAQLPNGAFETLAASDAAIKTMCPFYRKTGELFGVIIGGNFTSLGGTQVQGIALFNTTSNEVVPLPGFTGSVNAVWCDSETDAVFVGGDFSGYNSTNAIAWVGTSGWTAMPFKGFNAPVNSIAQASNGNIIWGGAFTGLGNMSTPTESNEQVINLSTANLSATGTTSTQGFNDPTAIVCKANGTDGPGGTWLLQDKTPGSISATFGFGFEPTKLRLWNTHQDGRGTKTWRFSNNPSSILRFNFSDPDNNNQISTCDSACPLSSNSSTPYQDFHFVNTVGMNSFTIDISDWFGEGDVFSYAIADFNEPTCGTTVSRSSATQTGKWVQTPSKQSVADYLTANLQGPNVNSASASVTFYPDIKQSGDYIVTIFTPGCQQDGTCDQRGQANITGVFSSTSAANPVHTTIFQTNDFDKYDQIYSGSINANDGGFRPHVILSPLDNQNDSITLTALRVQFQLLDPSSSSGLNGLYEYDPYNLTANTDFKASMIDSIGTNLDPGAYITSLQILNGTTYVAGNFTSANASNLLAIDSTNHTISLPGSGTNGPVNTITPFGNLLFVGGNFSNLNSTNITGLSNVALFDTGENKWSALGNGVNGLVTSIVPLSLNVTANTPEQCITINGPFSEVLATGQYPAFDVDGLAVWVPSKNSWLANLDVQMQAISGQLTAAINMTGNAPLISGTVAAQGWSLSDSAALSAESGVPTITSTRLRITPDSSTSSLKKRDSSATTANATGILAGTFDVAGGRNLTIFGGHFNAQASDRSNITNIAFISNNGTDITGIDSGIDANSTFLSLYTFGGTLFAGGVVTGNASGTAINGLVIWDLDKSAFNDSLPQALVGATVAVNAIQNRPNTGDTYVAGLFDMAGQLGCPSVCVLRGGQWSRPGQNFGGGNVTGMLWQGSNNLVVVGSGLLVNNQPTNVASYDANAQTWSIPSDASSVPGPVSALSPASADGSSYWIAGQNSSTDPYVMLYSGGSFKRTLVDLGTSSYIRGLTVFSLTQQHGSNDFIDPSLSLAVTGELVLPGFGNCSGALFDGNNYTAFLLSNIGNNPGSVGPIISTNLQNFITSATPLAVGFVVLIALAIALVIIFLLIALGLFIERRRRRAEGYRPAPQNYFEKTANMGRIPPERLFGNLNAPTSPRV